MPAQLQSTMPLDDSPNEKNSSVQEHVEDARTTESDVRSNQDNATVVLDIGAKTLEGSDLNRLKVAKDGHVSQPENLRSKFSSIGSTDT